MKKNLTDAEKRKREENLLKITKLLISIILVAILFLGIYLALKKSGALDKIDSSEELSEIIKGFGIYSRLIFILVQFLQVTLLPLPGFVTTVAGTLIFGPYETCILSLIAIITGSLFAFWLGKIFGTKILLWAIGKEDTEKWKKILTEGKYIFFLMMMFPMFPDDLLCMVAGVTNMSNKFFLVTNLITRPINIVCTCFLGSGYLIPFSGWGIYVWIIIVILLVVSFILCAKYQKKIEEYVKVIDASLSKFFHSKKKKNIKNERKLITELTSENAVTINNIEKENNTINTENLEKINDKKNVDIDIKKIKLEKK